MNWLLDTCVLSELTKPQPNANVVEWLDSAEERTLFLSVLSVGEILKGITKLPDGERKSRLGKWVETELSERFSGRLLDVTLEVAAEWGTLSGAAEQRGESLPAIDALLAATARSGGLTVVTRNEVDLSRCGARVFNPWLEAPK